MHNFHDTLQVYPYEIIRTMWKSDASVLSFDIVKMVDQVVYFEFERYVKHGNE